MSDNPEALLAEAGKAYYEGEPIMSDEQFDALEQQVVQEVGADQPVIAGGYVPETRKVDHVRPMLSLAKVHSQEDVIDWLRKRSLDLGGGDFDIVIEPKWDGLAIEVVVEDGVITMAATRGDGIVGENVTETVSKIPDVIDAVSALSQDSRHILYFEVVMYDDVLPAINSDFEMDFKNTRNAVAGIIRREDDLGRVLGSRLNAINHGGTKDWTRTTSLSDADEAVKLVSLIEAGRGQYPCQIDGVVIKLTDTEAQEQLGMTSHSPRWAVAYKFPAESTTTTLQSVSWRKGRTGRITPVATFDPVLLAGATITNATLHNEDFVNNLELRIGDKIMVKRSGDVIPYIEGVVQHNPEGELVQAPANIQDESVIVDQVHHALVTLGADGVGYSTVFALYDAGIIAGETVPEVLDSLLSLREGSLQHLHGFGERAEAKFLYAIDSTKMCYARTWVAALGIPALGRTVSAALEKQYGTIDAIIDAKYDDLIVLDGFGPTRVQVVLDAAPAIRELLDILNKHGIVPPREEVAEVATDSEWSGKNVVITGSFDGHSRSDISAALTALGANMQGSVSSKTDILVAGEKAGSKMAKAESLGITILTAADIDIDALFA